MEKVLKRVGLSRRSESVTTTPNTGTVAADNTTNSTGKTRRRRRSKSRRRVTTSTTESGGGGVEVVAKPRGVFNIDWTEYVKECKPSCRPRAITRRLCRGRRSEDNELYRSNSFKFERFVRGRDETIVSNTLEKQVAH